MFRLEHGEADRSALRKALPTLSHIQEAQSAWKDDFALNSMLRKRFRVSGAPAWARGPPAAEVTHVGGGRVQAHASYRLVVSPLSLFPHVTASPNSGHPREAPSPAALSNQGAPSGEPQLCLPDMSKGKRASSWGVGEARPAKRPSRALTCYSAASTGVRVHQPSPDGVPRPSSHARINARISLQWPPHPTPPAGKDCLKRESLLPRSVVMRVAVRKRLGETPALVCGGRGNRFPTPISRPLPSPAQSSLSACSRRPLADTVGGPCLGRAWRGGKRVL